ncbi:MAG: hypothetical protein K8963_10695, partial [Proteobacteria bacterium]|nr:hypothetical protein [Pseudomonadota bacterium]
MPYAPPSQGQLRRLPTFVIKAIVLTWLLASPVAHAYLIASSVNQQTSSGGSVSYRYTVKISGSASASHSTYRLLEVARPFTSAAPTETTHAYSRSARGFRFTKRTQGLYFYRLLRYQYLGTGGRYVDTGQAVAVAVWSTATRGQLNLSRVLLRSPHDDLYKIQWASSLNLTGVRLKESRYVNGFWGAPLIYGGSSPWTVSSRPVGRYKYELLINFRKSSVYYSG